MKIRCDSCGAKYSIAEGLLKKKVTKFRCKKCTHVMVIERPEPGVAEVASEQAPPADAYAAGGAVPSAESWGGQAEQAPVGGETKVQYVGDHGYGASGGDAYGDAGHQAEAAGESYNNTEYQAEAVYGSGQYEQSNYGQNSYEEEATAMGGDLYAQSQQMYGQDASYQQDQQYAQEQAVEGYEGEQYNDDGFGVDESVWDNEPSGEEDIYAGMDTRASALDDEFDQAFQEQAAEQQPPKEAYRAPNEPSIAPNYQEQGLVLRSQDESQMDAVAVREAQEQSTKVFSINALENLRTERQEARKEKRRRRGGRRGASNTAKSSAVNGAAASAAPVPAAAAKAAPPPPKKAIQEQAEWHVLVGGEQVGPLTLSDTKTRIKDGQINGETMCWKEGFSDWRTMADVPAFMSTLKQAASAAPASPPERTMISAAPESPSLAALAGNASPSAPPAPPTGGISFAPSPVASPSSGDLHSLASSANATPAAAVPVVSPFDAVSSGGSAIGSSTGFGSPSPGFSNTGGFGASSSSSVFGGSPFDNEKDKKSEGGGGTLKLLLVALSSSAVVALVLLFVLKPSIFMGTPQEVRPPAVPRSRGVTAKAGLRTLPRRAAPERRTPEARRAAPEPRAPEARPETRRPEPRPEARRATAPVRQRPVARRRYVRRRRPYRRRSYRRPTYRRPTYRRPAPRRRSAAPPPPPPPGGNDTPPPPPPPPSGGNDLPPPPPPPGRRSSGGNDLSSILGKKRPAPRRTSPGLPPPPPVPRRSSLPRSLSKPQIVRVMRSGYSKIRSCRNSYGSSVSLIRASWTIQGSGRARGIRVSPSSNSQLTSCVKRAISRWRFPRFSGAPLDIGPVPFQF